MPKISVGRTVLYVLSQYDVYAIESRRCPRDGGNRTAPGQVFPAVAVNVFGTSDNPPVNLRVILDGHDFHWATSRSEDPTKSPGTYHWPDRT